MGYGGNRERTSSPGGWWNGMPIDFSGSFFPSNKISTWVLGSCNIITIVLLKHRTGVCHWQSTGKLLGRMKGQQTVHYTEYTSHSRFRPDVQIT